MKKTLSFFIAGLFLSLSIFAQKNPFSFNIEPHFGIRNGILNEFVYANSSSTGNEYYESLLNWNLKNSFYSGITLDLSFKNFHINGDFKGFIPNNFGSMDDSDWLQDYYYNTGRTDVKTNFSSHDMDVIDGLNFTVKALYSFHPSKSITLSPSIGFAFEKYTLLAKNGYGWYGKGYGASDKSFYSYDDVLHRVRLDFNGHNVIRLEREDYYTWIGLSLDYAPAYSNWEFGFNIDVSPWTYIVSRDSHLERDTYFIDLGQGFFSAYKASIYAQYKLTQMTTFRVCATGLFTMDLKGNDYISTGSINGTYKNSGAVTGSATKYLDFQISALIRF